MLSIALIGSSGRMGRAIEAAADTDDFRSRIRIASRVNSRTSAAELEQAIHAGQVVLEFATPASLENTGRLCATLGKPLLVGVTGLEAGFADRAREWAQGIPVLIAPNTSLGVAVLAGLVRDAARQLGAAADIRIIETHHRHKKDAPSGTALALGEAAREGRGSPLDPSDYASVRAGDVVGEHRAVFALPGEQLILEHRATDRAIFARGALAAALWLSRARAGLFRMTDVLQKSELAVDTRSSRP